jgi:hypothetical protein
VDNPNETIDDSPEHIKKLRAEAESAKVLQKELEAKERQIAFLQAGVDTNSKLGQMLMKTYDGEMSPEAIRIEAAEIGLVQGEVQVENVAEVSNDQAQFQNAREHFTGGDTAKFEPPTRSAVDRAFDEWNDSRKSGLSSADAQDLAFASFIASAAQGDPTARFDEGEWRNKSTAFGHLG